MADFNGSSGDDVFAGGIDNDNAAGNGGNDTLSGGAGADILNGDDGNDQLYSFDISPPFNRPYYGNPWTPPLLDVGIEFDVLSGGAGTDLLFAGYGDMIDGGADVDILYISFLGAPSGVTVDFRQLQNNGSITIGGGTISNVEIVGWIEGSNFDDTITDSDNSADFTPMFGHGGNDRLNGGYYTGDIHGGDGDDIIDRGSSPYGFEHFGEAGNDLLIGSYNGEMLDGGSGDDELLGNGGFDTLRGGEGDDLIDPGSGWDHAYGGADDDTFRLSTLSSGSLVSTFDGEAGFDTFDFGVAASYLFFETNDSEANVFYVADNRVQGVEKVIGGSVGDIFSFVYFTDAIEAYGGNGDDSFDGGSGEDRFFGEQGDDRITLAAGDYGDGGEGDDEFFISGAFGTPPVSGSVLGGDGLDLLKLNISFDVDLAAGTATSGTATYSVSSIEAVMVAAHYGYHTIVRGGEASETLSVNPLFNDGSTGVAFEGRGGSDTLFGSNGADDLSGDGANDVLDGGTGIDTLDGGDGDDFFFASGDGDAFDGGTGIDTLDYRQATGAVTVTLALLAGQIGSGPGGDQLKNIENVNGTTNGDTLNGSNDANFLEGMGGNDTLDGKAGNDKLAGGFGEDSMTGGLGDDEFLVDNADDQVFEAAGGGDDVLRASTSYALAAGQHVERLVLFGDPAAPLGLTGNELANALVGNDASNALNGGDGNDVLEGGAGQDMMAGGTGDDDYYVDNAGDSVAELADEGDDAVYASVSYALAANQSVELLAAASHAATTALNLTGNSLANTLMGNAGANVLNGQGGADVLIGLQGNDTYVVDGAGDVVTEAAGGGIDIVYSGLSLALSDASEVENLSTLSWDSTDALNLTGNGLANTLIGNAGKNVLNGGAGADVMIGREGDDSYFVDSAGDRPTEYAGQGTDIVYTSISYALAANTDVESLSTLSWQATDALNLTGNGLANTLIGNAGVNQLNGGGGNDVMFGREGDDVYFVDSFSDRPTEYAGQGTDIVYTSISYALASNSDVESLATISFEATNAINLTGNGLANTLIGNAGVNQLNGGGGGDIMFGREGNDVYFVDSAGDRPTEYAGQGTDIVYTSISYALASNSDVESLATISFEATNAINLTGNGLANTLIGNDGNNQLDGKSGADVMVGRAGNDKYLVDNAADKVFEAAGGGQDVVFTAVSVALTNDQEIEGLSSIDWNATYALNLTGNSLRNNLIGNAGVNLLDGKAGNDTLQGREGADTYAFTTVLGATNIDLILGFSSADDTIMLENNGVFTGLSNGALPASAFVVGTAAQDLNDRIVYNQATGQLFFDADGSGVGAQIQFARLDGAPIVAANDFAVI